MRKVLRAGSLSVEVVRRPRLGRDVLRFTDLSVALAFLTRFARDEANEQKLRALLAEERPLAVEQLTRDEVIRALAVEVVSGKVGVVPLPVTPLVGWDAGAPEAEEQASAGPRREEKTWIGIELVDMKGEPIPGERYWIKLTDGSIREGRLDTRGRAYFGDLDPGDCDIRWPDLDDEATLPPTDAAAQRAAGADGQRRAGKKTWFEIELVGMDDRPIPGERYWVKLTDGNVREGRLDAGGRAYFGGLDPGMCSVRFPDLDEETLILPTGGG